jgi:UDP-glucose 4-epimerase
LAELGEPVLVLGGAGFLGTHIVGALLERGRVVRILDRSQSGPVHGWADRAEYQRGDFDNSTQLAEAMRGCRVVVHLVGTTLPKTSNEDVVYDLESNLITSVRFLELAWRHGVKKVVFASSGGTVYGVPTILPIPESHGTRPLCSYGVHKLAIEHYLHLYRHLYGLDYSVLRVSNLFGERQRGLGQGAVAVFLQSALRNEEVVIWGDGSVIRDYVYAGDVADAFCRAIDFAGEPRTFNIGSGQGVTLNELLKVMERVLSRPIARRYVAGRSFDVPANVLDITLAGSHLGWRPTHSLEQGILKTVEWIRADMAV